MRVLHLDAGREWRGGQRQVFLLATGLRQLGHEPLVVSQPDTPLLRRVRAHGVAVAAVRMRGDWDLAAARRVRTLIRAWKPDVVHAHDARAHAIALTALVGSREIPLIVTRRVPFVPRSVRVKYGRRITRFIAISRAVRDAMVRGGIDRSRIDVVYSGVPMPEVGEARDWRRERGWPADTVLCGVVGAMTPEKGLDTLAAIAAHLPAGIRSRTRFVLIGGDQEGAVSIGGVEGWRAGFVEEIHNAMAGLDLLWHPSTAEGLGTVVVDAMALGVPPVAFAVGGLPELIESGRNGVLVPAGDAAAFADLAARLITDDVARKALGAHGPERAGAFDAHHMVEGTLRVYLEALDARSARAG